MARDIAAWIEEEIGAEVIDWPQSNAFAVREYDAFMEGLRGRKLTHTGDAGLRAHVLNAIAAVLPSGDAKFERPSQTRVASAQSRRVIDALKAAAMVHCAAVDANANAEPDREPLVAWA